MNEHTRFWVRVVFYILILVALIYVGIRAGGDPCNRCSMENKDGEIVTCRESLEFYAKTMGWIINNPMDSLNISGLNISS